LESQRVVEGGFENTEVVSTHCSEDFYAGEGKGSETKRVGEGWGPKGEGWFGFALAVSSDKTLPRGLKKRVGTVQGELPRPAVGTKPAMAKGVSNGVSVPS